jgi:hypothetical protein
MLKKRTKIGSPDSFLGSKKSQGKVDSLRCIFDRLLETLGKGTKRRRKKGPKSKQKTTPKSTKCTMGSPKRRRNHET